jgi:hypothetical protein
MERREKTLLMSRIEALSSAKMLYISFMRSFAAWYST